MIESFIEAVNQGSEEIILETSRLIPLDLNENHINTIIDIFPIIVNNFTEVFEFEHRKELIKHFRYESVIWDIGECFRNILKRNRKLRKNSIIFKRIEEVALNSLYGKGRESFVMLLGQYGGRDYIPTLIKLLDDSSVNGHAVYALRLLKATEVKDYIEPFLYCKKTWIRNEAKKFFENIR